MCVDDTECTNRGIRFIFEEEFAEQAEKHKKEISHLYDEISHLYDEISLKNDEISHLDDEIANLKSILKTNGVDF